ncbi:MAG TPA: hypothetical protein VKG45_13060 [Actinomycetes bacterium]|nr:hypothetical protein [Actinomycetes bacterium]
MVALTGAAVVPHPPLLIPALAGAAPELAALRAACLDAVRTALTGAERRVVVSAGDRWGSAAPAAAGSFAAYGPAGAAVQARFAATRAAPPVAGLGEPAPLAELPLPLAVAAWLLARLGDDRPVVAVTLPSSTPPAVAASAGRALAAASRATGMLVVGDGSARRTERAPGGFHAGAAAADRRLARALRSGDAAGLLALDVAAASELLVAGRVPLQALAGALDGRPWQGRLLYDDAPYGVGYLVASCVPLP